MDYLKSCQSFMTGTGLVPSSSTFRMLLAKFIFLPICLILYTLTIYQLLETHDVFLITEDLESLSTYTQISVRKYILMTHGKLIEEIFIDCQHQWPFDLFGPETRDKFENQMKLCWNIVKFLIICGCFTIVLLCLSAFTDETKSLPFAAWVPEHKYGNKVVFTFQILFLMEVIYYVIATDSFFLLTTMLIQIQYKMMRKKLGEVQFGKGSDTECLEKLILVVKQHNKILKLHHKVNKVYSEYFLVQYTISVITVATQAYLLMYNPATVESVLKSVFYMISLMVQVAIYFFPASNVEIEAENFSKSIYFLNWDENKNVQIGKHILFMIMKSQKSLEMLGGRMLHINRTEYLLIFRLGFTIATLLGGSKY